MKVVPWTVDDPATMQSLIDKGVDGIITDYPDRVRTSPARTASGCPRRTTLPPSGRCRRAHAHNDYDHRRPLQDALDRGFNSVEADVWLIDGELRVAHDLDDAVPGRNLESLYLQPLADRVRENHGRGLQAWTRLPVADRHQERRPVDVRGDRQGAAEVPRASARSSSTGGRCSGAVTSVISGNRPLDVLKAQKIRYAGYDGRLGPTCSSEMPASLMPLVSDNWSNNFTWRGLGPMPAAEQAKLHDIVVTAHHAGYRVRFWETPDTPGAAREAVWRELVAAGVDHLNTDDLHGLEDFLARLGRDFREGDDVFALTEGLALLDRAVAVRQRHAEVRRHTRSDSSSSCSAGSTCRRRCSITSVIGSRFGA